MASAYEQQRIARSKMEQLERENGRLVKQLKEVIKMNTHWQRYDTQREEYVLKLIKTVREQQDKLQDLEQQIQRLTINKSDTGNGQAEADKHKGQSEANDDPIPEADNNVTSSGHQTTRVTTPSLTALRTEEEIAALTDHIADLKDKIFRLGNRRESARQTDEEELLLLREQVDVCIEDFQQERSDRERIHGDNEMLRERLAQAEEQINVYRVQLKQLQRRRSQVNNLPTRNGYEEPCCYPDERPYYRHPVYYGDDLTDLPTDVEIDGGFVEPEEDKQLNGDTTTATDALDVIVQDQSSEEEDDVRGGKIQRGDLDGTLECPRCQAMFDSNGYDDLLKHTDKCLE